MARLNRIDLITGGCRSGKSAEALRLAQNALGEKFFLATCPRPQKGDDEMVRRIANHIQEREALNFITIEEPLDLATLFDRYGEAKPNSVWVIDCISLWVSNQMLEAAHRGIVLDEAQIARQVRNLLQSARKISGQVIVVTNEVGLGGVPDHRLARQFRDLLGRANQEIALASDGVLLMVSGIGMRIK